MSVYMIEEPRKLDLHAAAAAFAGYRATPGRDVRGIEGAKALGLREGAPENPAQAYFLVDVDGLSGGDREAKKVSSHPREIGEAGLFVRERPVAGARIYRAFFDEGSIKVEATEHEIQTISPPDPIDYYFVTVIKKLHKRTGAPLLDRVRKGIQDLLKLVTKSD